MGLGQKADNLLCFGAIEKGYEQVRKKTVCGKSAVKFLDFVAI
jgi:hypothetical protein